MSEYKNKILLVLGYILSVTLLLLQVKSIISSYSNYPFTLGWSEGGRIFAAYQVYAPIIAGKYLSLPWLDPGRSILDGLVLLIPHVSIGSYRLWINILFFIFSFLAALATVNKALSFSEIPGQAKERTGRIAQPLGNSLSVTRANLLSFACRDNTNSLVLR